VVFHARAMTTEVCGAGNSDAHAKFDAAKVGRAGAPPLFTEELSNPFEAVDCIGAEHAINRNGTKWRRCWKHFFWCFFFFASS